MKEEYPILAFNVDNFDERKIQEFREYIYHYYALNRRSFAWREEITPYRVFVSEIMLQQTQTYRVEKKFEEWMRRFPTFESLAEASLSDVLNSWMGLGYNRRALWMQQAAQKIVGHYSGIMPNNPSLLLECKGIGKATSCSLVTFAYNIPTMFIETNVRAVYLALFFSKEARKITDKELVPLVQVTVDQESPRDWYYALMDMGVHFKKKLANPSRASTHHQVQSKFEGSFRQLRAKILKKILQEKIIDLEKLTFYCEKDPRLSQALESLKIDGLIQLTKNGCMIGALS